MTLASLLFPAVSTCCVVCSLEQLAHNIQYSCQFPALFSQQVNSRYFPEECEAMSFFRSKRILSRQKSEICLILPTVLLQMSISEGQFYSHSAQSQTGQDELLIKAGSPGSGGLKVIEWHHLNLPLFLPSTTIGSLVVRTSLYPLAVLRSRLQLQKQHLVYRNTLHALVDTARSEGIRGLFRGFLITVPQIGASFVYAGVYEGARASMQQDFGIKSVAVISGVAGGMASLATQTIFVPTDIVSQYMMVYFKANNLMAGNDRAVLNRLNANLDKGSLGIRTVKAIYHCDGIKGFYRGFGASALSYVPQCTVMWPTYYAVQDFLHKLHPPTNRGLMVDQAVAAACGGIMATLVTNPFEMMRIRMQMHRTTYKETIERMIRNEGWLMLTKGIAPRLITNTLTSCLLVTGYEIVKRLCVKEEYKHQIQW